MQYIPNDLNKEKTNDGDKRDIFGWIILNNYMAL